MAEQAVTAGYQATLAIGKQSTFGTAPTGYDAYFLVSEGLEQEKTTKTHTGATGSPGRLVERRSDRLRGVAGPMSLEVHQDRISEMMEMFFGEDVSSGSFAFPSTDGPSDLNFYAIELGKGAGAFRALDCKPSRATLRSNDSDGDLMMDIDWIGSNIVSGVTLASGDNLSDLPSGPILQHYHLKSLTLNNGGSISLRPQSVELVVDHGLKTDVYRNSQTRIGIPRGKRSVSGTFVLDYNSVTEEFFDNWIDETDFGFVLVYEITVGENTYTLTIQTHSSDAGARFDGGMPHIDPEETVNLITLPFTCYAEADDGNNELAASLATA